MTTLPDYDRKFLDDVIEHPLPLAFVKHLTPEARQAFHRLFEAGLIKQLSADDHCYHAAPEPATSEASGEPRDTYVRADKLTVGTHVGKYVAGKYTERGVVKHINLHQKDGSVFLQLNNGKMTLGVTCTADDLWIVPAQR